MADLIIILVLLTLAALALRSCLHRKKEGGCHGGCSGCGSSCSCNNKQKKQ